MTFSLIQCSECETPLSGGIDTFGTQEEPLCLSCHYAVRGEDGLSDEDAAELHALMERCAPLLERLQEARQEYAHRQRKADEAETEVGRLREMLIALGWNPDADDEDEVAA